MNREQILSTVQALPVETRVKAWVFQIENSENKKLVTYYQVVETYGGYGILPQTLIWACNKRGKRLTVDPIFKRNGPNHLAGINEYLDILELQAIDEN